VKRSGRDEQITHVNGSNATNLSVYLSLSQASKNDMSFLLSLVFSSTELKNKAEHVLPGSEGGMHI
jgi:hypothetical protein